MERPLDRLLPQAVALVAGLGVLAAVAGGVAAGIATGAPGGASGFGAAVLLPLALFAAILGFAAGHGAGALLRRHNLTPSVPVRPYRVVLTLVLGAAMVIGALLGARPVLRHERVHRLAVLEDSGAVEKIAMPLQCARRDASASGCDPSRRVDAQAISWNGRETTVTCGDGRVALTDADGAVLTSVDLSQFRFPRVVYAAPVMGGDGRQAMVLVARLNQRVSRAMVMVFDADARLVYQELVEDRAPADSALEICRGDEGDVFAFGGAAGATYRLR